MIKLTQILKEVQVSSQPIKIKAINVDDTLWFKIENHKYRGHFSPEGWTRPWDANGTPTWKDETVLINNFKSDSDKQNVLINYLQRKFIPYNKILGGSIVIPLKYFALNIPIKSRSKDEYIEKIKNKNLELNTQDRIKYKEVYKILDLLKSKKMVTSQASFKAYGYKRGPYIGWLKQQPNEILNIIYDKLSKTT